MSLIGLGGHRILLVVTDKLTTYMILNQVKTVIPQLDCKSNEDRDLTLYLFISQHLV